MTRKDEDWCTGAIVRMQLQPQHELAVMEAMARGDHCEIVFRIDGRKLTLEAQAGLPAGSYRVIKSELETVN